jgi:hypothetical protein
LSDDAAEDLVPEIPDWEFDCGHITTVTDRSKCCRLSCGWYDTDPPRAPDPYRQCPGDENYEDDVEKYECFLDCTEGY